MLFAFVGRTADEALTKMQAHMQGDLLDGYPVTHAFLCAMSVYWRVIVVCLPEREQQEP